MHEQGGVNGEALRRVVDETVKLRTDGHPVALVTSGAVAAGLPDLGLGGRPRDIPGLQVAAAVGQSRLMEHYATAFGEAGLVAAQVLLTKDVLADRGQYLNARHALDRMMQLGLVPVVNKNDTVVVDDLRLGDNDRLAAIVAQLLGAGLLVILTDTAGLFSADPRAGEGELLSAVRHTDQILDGLAGTGPLGSGGVASKVAAARMAAWSGIPTVVTAAETQDILLSVVAGREVGTWIEPHSDRLPARKLWIAFCQPSAGRLSIDSGAVTALVDKGRSLLPIGVVGVEGRFQAGEAVEVLGPDGGLVAKGLVRLDSVAMESARGRRSDGGEAIHRDDLVVLASGAR